MQPGELLQIIVQSAIAFGFFYLFAGVGYLVESLVGKQKRSSAPSSLFFHFLYGLILLISLYSVIVTKGRTINFLLLPLLYFLFRANYNQPPSHVSAAPSASIRFFEVAFICLLSVVILHLFPETEYKQNDSFFYLKISESLNLSGQENISHYANLYSSMYHGMEPYHYFELWVTSFIIRFTDSFYPSIHIARFVTQGIFLTGVITGLYTFARQASGKRQSLVQKAFCWSLLFIMPNIITYVPRLLTVFVSDFEGNMIARPNFRIIYLFFIPVLMQLQKCKVVTRSALLLLLMLCVVSFQFMVVFLPGIGLYSLWLWYTKKENVGSILFITILFVAFFAAFYFFFGQTNIPSFVGSDMQEFLFKTLHGYRFILFSIATSVLYTFFVISLLLLPVFVLNKSRLLVTLKHNGRIFLPLLCLALSGVLMARVFYLKDNAYQFIFITHIIATFFLWTIYLTIGGADKKRVYWIGSALFLGTWLLQWFFIGNGSTNVFKQNGQYIYNGKPYSATYIAQVTDYFKTAKPGPGAYIADSNFYSKLYYSRRNPNIYFLPINYVVANTHNYNVEFCVSDTAAISQPEQNEIYTNYVDNAIHRSPFFQYTQQQPGVSHAEQAASFIASNNLAYLIATPGIDVSLLNIAVQRKFTDSQTGEQFVILSLR